MTSTVKAAIKYSLGCTVANFFWQGFLWRRWELAAQLSFFQAWALVFFARSIKEIPATKDDQQ